MIFFALKISRGGVCCMPAALLLIQKKKNIIKGTLAAKTQLNVVSCPPNQRLTGSGGHIGFGVDPFGGRITFSPHTLSSKPVGGL